MFKNRWWVLVASFLGMACGPGPILVFAFAVFMKPISDDLGIGRALLSSAAIVASLVGIIGPPSVGYLIDRFGARKVMVPGILLFALGLSGHSQLTSAPLVIYFFFLLGNLFSSAASPVPFGIVIARWFDQMRGLALGISMAGIGVGTAVVPQLTAYLVNHYGWRLAYVGLALTIVVFSWIPVVLFVHEPPAFEQSRKRHDAALAHLTGVTASEAFRNWRWWAMTAAFFLGAIAINGTLTHVVALLADRGLPLQVAASALAPAGIALIFGRIISGWCLDRYHGPYVALASFVIPIAGILLLASSEGGVMPLIGTTLCGLGIGAEVDLMAFLISRYMGMKAYGRVYGACFAVFVIGNGIGSVIAGFSYDHFHSYTPAFLGFAGALIVTCALLLPLGPYPFPAQRRAAPLRETSNAPA
jgi:MFS family permease